MVGGRWFWAAGTDPFLFLALARWHRASQSLQVECAFRSVVVLGARFHVRIDPLFLDVLKMIFNFVLGPPLPRGVPGEAFS